MIRGARRCFPRSFRSAGLRLAAILGTGALAFAPPAAAATNFSWAGADSSSYDWSAADNWSTDSAPTAPIGGLSFRDLGTACDSGTSSAACYLSEDDLGPATVDQLALDNASPYLLAPEDPTTDTITIDANASCGTLALCGLSAAPGEAAAGQYPPDIGIPIVLGNNQTWYIDGGYTSSGFGDLGLEVDQVSGSSSSLLLDFAGGGTLYGTTLNTGALRAQANGFGSGYLVLEQSAGTGGAPIDAELSPAGLTLQDGMTFVDESPGTTSGPISVQSESSNESLLLIGQDSAPDATLAVTGQVSLDSGTDMVFDVDDNGSTPGTDFTQLTATGAINFANSSLIAQQGLDSAGGCADLATGDTMVLASASGGLTGDIKYTDVNGDAATLAPGQISAPIPIGSCPDGNTAAVATLTYGSNTITATIAGAAPIAGVQAPAIAGTPAIANTLTTTSPGSWQGSAPMNYTYQWLRCFDSYCSAISGATGSRYQLTDADYNEQLEVQVTASNRFGSASADSNALGPVMNAGAAGAKPAISGVPRVGQTLTTTPGSWAGSPSLTYQWQSCTSSALYSCSTIVGANTASYTPVANDLGKYLHVMVCPGSAISGCESSTPVGPVLAAFPSLASLDAALSRIGHPTSRSAAARLRTTGSFVTEFTAPSVGSLSVVWTTQVTTGKGKHKKTKTVTVATGTAKAGNAGALKIRLHLTDAGRTLLMKKLTGLQTSATEKFEPTGGSWTSVTKRFSL